MFLTTDGNRVSWRWNSFTPSEMLCRCGCESMIDEQFMDSLQWLRSDFGKPMPITSGHRCLDHNKAVGGSETSGHLTARAADVRIKWGDALELLCMADKRGFTRLGVNQKGPYDKRFIHLGMDKPEKTIWSY
tara:strand:+ start:33 stop:428 length:396 start_codon:yes stop_codon:yes gene_type:complete